MFFFLNILIGLALGGVVWALIRRTTAPDWAAVVAGIAAFFLTFILNIAERLANL